MICRDTITTHVQSTAHTWLCFLCFVPLNLRSTLRHTPFLPFDEMERRKIRKEKKNVWHMLNRYHSFGWLSVESLARVFVRVSHNTSTTHTHTRYTNILMIQYTSVSIGGNNNKRETKERKKRSNQKMRELDKVCVVYTLCIRHEHTQFQ